MVRMTSLVRHAALAAATLLTFSAVSSCSSDDPAASPAPVTSPAASPSGSPAVCSSFDDLKASVADLQDVKVGDDGLSQLRSSLVGVKEDLQQVMSDAEEQFKPEITAVSSSVDDLQTSLKAAQSDPTAATFGPVATAVGGLVSGIAALEQAVSSAC